MFKSEVFRPLRSNISDSYHCLQWLVDYFGRLTAEQSMACMQEMLRMNMRQNLQVVIQIATKYSDILGPVKLIEMFESFKSFEGRLSQSPSYIGSLHIRRSLLLSRIYRQP